MNLIRILAICGIGVIGGVLFRDGSFWLGLGLVLSGVYLELHRTAEVQQLRRRMNAMLRPSVSLEEEVMEDIQEMDDAAS